MNMQIHVNCTEAQIISQTLNNDFQSLYDYKFSIDLAKSTLEFYNTNNIPKIKALKIDKYDN